MKTQKFLVEVTDLTGQFPVSESSIKKTLDDHLPGAYRFNVVEQAEIMQEEIRRNGEELGNWACDVGPDGQTEANGGVERLLHYKGSYYTLITDWGGQEIYPNTLTEIKPDELDDCFIRKLIREHEGG